MFWWKLFSKRRGTSDEGALHPSSAARTASAASNAAESEKSAADLQLVEDKSHRPMGGKGGFDPYNSGAFDRRGNWDKTRLK